MMSYTACLFLLSACLAGVTASEKLQKRAAETSTSGPTDVSIAGPDKVTIGIPYGFSCTANCPSSCVFTMTLDGQTKMSSSFDTVFKNRVPSEVITCEATDTATGKTASVSKTIQVADGPYNVSIEAPKMLMTGVPATLTCNVVCYPSCTYSWYLNQLKTAPIQASTSNQLNYTTTLYSGSQTIYCKVQNSLTKLYVVTSTTVTVPYGPQDIYISGPSSAMVGQTAVFYCINNNCIPSCNNVWLYNGKTYEGSPVHLPVLSQGKPVLAYRLIVDMESYQKNETVTCTAVNTLSGKTDTTSVTIRVTDPISVRVLTVTPPVAESTYSLQCAGTKSGASIQWTKDGKALSTSARVYLSDSNVTLTFAPLIPSDTGSYQCIVQQQGEVIPGVPYDLSVIYGPWDAVVTVSDSNKPVGAITYLLPETSTTFTCSAKCYPTCEYAWYVNGEEKAENSTFTVSSANVTDETQIACVPINRATNNYTEVVTIVEYSGGPYDVNISGPDSVQVGVKATFECSAICTPGCVYTWDVYGTTLHGSTIDFTISRYVATETVTCTAQNVITGKRSAINETLDVTDPNWCGC